jgi:pimeloyl-ACP methyl ester carboxylesterase
MTESLPSIVVVPGAYHQPLHYASFMELLLKNGFVDVVASRLASAALDPPEEAFADDVRLLRTEITQRLDAGQNLVILAHSYGGVVTTEALVGMPGALERVKGIIFLSALVPETGESVATCVPGGLADWVKIEVRKFWSWVYCGSMLIGIRFTATHMHGCGSRKGVLQHTYRLWSARGSCCSCHSTISGVFYGSRYGCELEKLPVRLYSVFAR